MFGSDEEVAMRQAIERSFMETDMIGFMRHMRKHLSHNLADKFGLTGDQRAAICNGLFSNTGKGFKYKTLVSAGEAIDSIVAKTVPEAARYIERSFSQTLKLV